jgi:phenylacetate-coenzyme A ligase PaaK-like adenylate-forming protein
LDNFKSFKSLLCTVNDGNMDDIAMRLFRYQVIHNPVYARYITYLGTNIHAVRSVNEIPFLPISFFKSQELKTASWQTETRFTSSGTTGTATSTHHVADLSFYLQHAEQCFMRSFGSLKEYHFLALMPSYLERGNSSLIAMISSFIKKSESEHSKFYLNEYEELLQDIVQLKKQGGRKVILWGVSFALLDLAEKQQPDLSDCLIFETGGMKGRRKEITRQELHSQLKRYFNVPNVYSEYGMTELLSQAYTRGGDSFYPPPSMKIVIRESVDPFAKGQIERAGGLNVIDLANFHSIAFIETEDAGRVYADGSFEVLGRLDNSDVRGCNLMVE